VSYSFSLKAASKELAAIMVRDQLVQVCQHQPVHTKDCDQAQAAAEAMIAILPDDPAKDVGVSVSGWLSWEGADKASRTFTGANVNVTVGLQAREAK
jgi:hypothetical protein